MKTVAPLLAFLVWASAGGAPGEDRVLLRVHPTDVRWGEIAIAEGGEVEVASPRETRRYPFSLAITCTERERKEGRGASTASPSRFVGSVRLAADLALGREGWKDLVGSLTGRLEGLTPETFGDFAGGIVEALVEADPTRREPFHAVACVTDAGQVGSAVGARRERGEDGGITTGSEAWRDGRAVCSTLAGALDGEPPREILTSPFVVGAQLEESLAVRTRQSDGPPLADWPEGVEFGYEPAPPGAAAYSSTHTGGDGSSFEELRTSPQEGASGAPEARVLKARVTNATIPKSALDGDAVLVRWEWRLRETRLGTDPATLSESEQPLDLALLFVGPHGSVDVEGWAKTAARDFASASDPPGIPLLSKLLRDAWKALGVDGVLAVHCDPERPDDALYCVTRICEHVANGREFCRALAVRLD